MILKNYPEKFPKLSMDKKTEFNWLKNISIGFTIVSVGISIAVILFILSS